MEPQLTKEEARSAVFKALGRSDFVLEKLEEDDEDTSSLGFMARNQKLVASVRLGREGETRVVSLFVKFPPTSPAHRQFLEELRHFEKEAGMYDAVVPEMSSVLPEGYHVPLPRCYLTRKADEKEGIREMVILEDLTQVGYRMWNKMVPFDRPHCLSVMRCLAEFHAPSFLIQSSAGTGNNLDYAGGRFSLAKDRILVDTGGEMSRRWAETSVKTFASAACGLWPERFKVQGSLAGAIWGVWKEVSAMAEPSRKYTNVVCHGDLWANNMLFRYEGGHPSDTKLVDLQLVRFAPPATDILMFLHNSTTRAFRDENLRDLALAYHRHLEEIVGQPALDQLMPSSALLESLRDFAAFGKLVGAVWTSIILGDNDVPGEGGETPGSDEPVDFVAAIMQDRGKKVLLDSRKSQVFRNRVMESYQECLQHIGVWE